MPKPSRLVACPALIVATVLAAPGMCGELPVWSPDANAPRSAIPAVYTWDLTPLFASDQAFEQARVKLLGGAPGAGQVRGQARRPGSAGGLPRPATSASTGTPTS